MQTQILNHFKWHHKAFVLLNLIFIALQFILHAALVCSAASEGKCLSQLEAGTAILFFRLGYSCVLYNVLYSEISIFFIE